MAVWKKSKDIAKCSHLFINSDVILSAYNGKDLGSLRIFPMEINAK